MEFKPYQHIEKLGTPATEGLLDGVVSVFPKLDGTNASIWREGMQDRLHFGSRNRELSLEKDNHGFMNAFINSGKQIIVHKLLDELGNVIIFGEWLIPNNIKNYKDDAWRKFYVFDVFDLDTFEYRDYEEWRGVVYSASEKCNLIQIVPAIDKVNGSDVDVDLYLIGNNYLMKDGCGVGEGIVIKRYGYKNPFGHTVWGKVIHSDYTQKKVQRSQAPKDSVESQIIDKFFDLSIINKEWGIIRKDGHWTSEGSYNLLWGPSYYPRLIEQCWKIFLTEEVYNFTKKFKNPTVDFKKLRGQLTVKLKEYVEGVGLK